MNENHFTNWFKDRGLKPFNYQKEILLTKIPESLNNNTQPTVLAACPAAGKTVISI